MHSEEHDPRNRKLFWEKKWKLSSREKRDIVKQILKGLYCIVYLDCQNVIICNVLFAKPVQDRDGNIHNNIRELTRKSWYFFSRATTYSKTSSYQKGGSVIVSIVSRLLKKKKSENFMRKF